MPEPSQSAVFSSREEPIVVDDDDDVVPVTAAVNLPAHSPNNSLRDITPAASISASSTNSSDQANALQPNGSSGGDDALDTSSPQDKFRTGYVFSADMMLHVNPIEPEHPERPLRIWKIFLGFKKHDLFTHMKRIPIREAKEDEVALVHDKGIWEGVTRSALYRADVLKEQVPMLEISSSLYVNEHSAYAARLSCGGAIELCDAVASGRIRNGFAIVRPPGHHAEPQKSMGFCFFNNVAVATQVVMQKNPDIQKVLILDWDVHHGNGTQRAFEDNPNVMYMSLHRYDEDGSFYPGSSYGNYTSIGIGNGAHYSVNVPWPTRGMGDADYLYAFHNLIMPIAQEFSPDLVIISAGFDAAEGDPIGQNKVTPGGFAQMTHLLTSLCNGKVAVVLEGGYNPDAVASSALAVTDVLLSFNTLPPSSTVASTIAAETVRRVREEHQTKWTSLKVAGAGVNDVETNPARAPDAVKIGDMLAEYRNSVIANEFDLFEIPLDATPHRHFAGHVLCSEGILDSFSTIIFFVHDMGNLRLERPRASAAYEEDALQLVDASRRILKYAKKRNYGIVDLNIINCFSAQKVISPSGVRRTATEVELLKLDEAKKAAAFIWDNVVALARSSGGEKKIVLLGFGSGCDALTSIVDERDVKSDVRAVVNVVGYGEMPCVSINADLDKKKWYYRRSLVLAPEDHRHLLDRGEAAPLKRFGKIKPVADTAAINIFSSRFGEIKSFLDVKLNPSKKAGIANAAP
ncbi:Histone deacetylase domain protein [Kalmanozyma brasiliensis GHG001]|uniref:histone deacetylase n=1 Tax=Kalmanozyma brasiliensis (strain GHG001) TaxID=1365824 RepID=V5E3H6_KALBG|nr:Histone deacetylase domain protein [Kalmanozyma brasiliensis GHG001]EST04726.1 Histone deacetylase domain protein [Kalmanozyma brasiliensis GHG001]